MHRVINCPTRSNNLHGFVSNFDRRVNEEFQRCRLTFYKQETLNALITNNRMVLGPEDELVKKQGQQDLSICHRLKRLI